MLSIRSPYYYNYFNFNLTHIRKAGKASEMRKVCLGGPDLCPGRHHQTLQIAHHHHLETIPKSLAMVHRTTHATTHIPLRMYIRVPTQLFERLNWLATLNDLQHIIFLHKKD